MGYTVSSATLPFNVLQCISILKLTADRVDKDDAYFLKCDVGQLLLPIARFLDRPLMGASDLRTKAQFCNLTEKFLKRRDIFTVRRDTGIRNTLLDITMNWTSEMLSTVCVRLSTVALPA
jgi:hypothetical protein